MHSALDRPVTNEISSHPPLRHAFDQCNPTRPHLHVPARFLCMSSRLPFGKGVCTAASGAAPWVHDVLVFRLTTAEDEDGDGEGGCFWGNHDPDRGGYEGGVEAVIDGVRRLSELLVHAGTWFGCGGEDEKQGAAGTRLMETIAHCGGTMGTRPPPLRAVPLHDIRSTSSRSHRSLRFPSLPRHGCYLLHQQDEDEGRGAGTPAMETVLKHPDHETQHPFYPTVSLRSSPFSALHPFPDAAAIQPFRCLRQRPSSRRCVPGAKFAVK
ncbi:hypothetical protein C8R45DRAFT_1107114 [Mycena sanguinolenta]|nr:hypothetical protein C8R45DRAFT_1107114 [Mycena sanguinolenta]